MTRKEVGQRIRELRKVRQLSVRELAARVAISISLLEKVETGSRLRHLAQARPPTGVRDGRPVWRSPPHPDRVREAAG
ncbi:helix-turn-helix domain-containing protein [Streptomyces sp. NPDC088730]|uniref:helix-turn-helix domain-containing protein n=1 Tax=Streptomyces sp. NPDC088730 TaxID=3365877 RepID=UPI003826DB9E